MSKDISTTLADGKRHIFRFDFNALCALEEEFGITLGEFDRIFGGPGKEGKVSMKDLRILVWAALVHENEALTPKEAGGLIDPKRIVEITEKVAEALMTAFPEADAGEKKNTEGPKPESGTGKDS